MSGYHLLYAASLVVLVPAVVGMFIAGYRAQRLRWWQLLTFGVLAIGIFYYLTGLPGIREHFTPLLRAWLAANLLLAPLLGGLPGHLIGTRQREAWRRLQPRPWGG
jgi:hypothetical protein